MIDRSVQKRGGSSNDRNDIKFFGVWLGFKQV
jgi:hypothetical protein